MSKLDAVLIASGYVRFQRLQTIALECEGLQIVRTFDGYPPLRDLPRLLQIAEPDIILLDLVDRESALAVAEVAHGTCPQTPVIGFGGNPDEHFDTARTGIACALPAECLTQDLTAAMEFALHAFPLKGTGHLYAFLPSKAGSGASTVALNTAAMLAGPLGKRTLLLEADLRSGVLSVALDRELTGSTQSALAMGQTMDIFRWDSCLTRLGQLDLLLSSRSVPARLPTWTDYYSLLKFVMPRYEAVFVDLPELVNPATAEIVRRAETVFLVCTQEVLSLKLAAQRLRDLAEWGVPSNKIQVLINRWHNRELPREDVIRLLQRPIAAAFPNDYKTVRESLLSGRPVPPESPLGGAFLQFTCRLLNLPAPRDQRSRWPLARMLRSMTEPKPTPHPAR